MNFKKHISLSLLGLCLLGCQSVAAPTSITYTKIESCIEQIENENAAFSELQCSNIGEYSLNITQQSPLYFNVILSHKGKTASSELDTFSYELPIEPGKAIEWHLTEGTPRFMIFRIFVQEENQIINEQLTLSLVADERICPVVSVSIKNNPNANEIIRSLISAKYKDIKSCPSDIERI